MIQLIFALTILLFKLIKLILIKTRLYIVAVPMIVVLVLLSGWHRANTFIVGSIGIILIIIVLISRIYTLIKHTKSRKFNN